jgi:TonB family protein
MFEDYAPVPKKKGRSLRDKAVGVLVTLLFHALLGVLVYHTRFTIKIFPFGKESVRSVVIVPPLKVSIPRVVGGRGLAEVPADRAEAVGPPASRTVEEPAAAAGEEAGEPAGWPGGEPGQPAGGAAPPTGFVIPSLSSRFRDSLAVRGKSDLTIPLAPPGTPSGPPRIGGGAPLPDFSKYDRGAYGGGVGGYGTGRGRGSVPGGRQRIGMSIPIKGYDILPWASVVIDRLQLHWALPAVQELPDAAKIGMIVVIKKSGELDSIEILAGTTIEALDRAALEAVRTSLPFPALPADFPGDLLEITFEFVYND